MGIDWEGILGVEDNLGDAYDSLIGDYDDDYSDISYDECDNQEVEDDIDEEERKILYKSETYHDNNGNQMQIVSFEHEGKTIKFNRTWAGYTFTDCEIIDLISGKSITFDCKHSNGKDYFVTGRLAGCEYNGKRFIGFSAYSFVPIIFDEYDNIL